MRSVNSAMTARPDDAHPLAGIAERVCAAQQNRQVPHRNHHSREDKTAFEEADRAWWPLDGNASMSATALGDAARKSDGVALAASFTVILDARAVREIVLPQSASGTAHVCG